MRKYYTINYNTYEIADTIYNILTEIVLAMDTRTNTNYYCFN